MERPVTRRPTSRGAQGDQAGLALTSAAVALLALARTAVSVVFDLPLATLVVASAAAAVLGWSLSRGSAGGRARARPATVALLAVAVAIAAVAVRLEFLSFAHEDIVFTNWGVTLAGTLYRPRVAGPHPAVVIVHGSGPERRREYAYYAKRLARAGMASLVYDKRGTGASTGALYAADYQDYARDVAAAVRALRARADIRAERIGLVGFSEAEWTAPLAALEVGGIAAIAIVGASGVSPAAQVNAEIAIRLRERGYPDTIVAEALDLNNRVFAYERTGQGADALQAALKAAAAQRWFRDAGDIPDALYPMADYAWWRSVMDFDPSPVWARVTAPVLLLKGGRDPQSPADVARREITAALARGGNHRGEFVLVPDGDHQLLTWPLGRGVPPPLFAGPYPDTLVSWMKARLDATGGSAP